MIGVCRGVARGYSGWFGGQCDRETVTRGLSPSPLGGPGACSPGKFWSFRLKIRHFPAFSAWNFAGRAWPIYICTFLPCQFKLRERWVPNPTSSPAILVFSITGVDCYNAVTSPMHQPKLSDACDSDCGLHSAKPVWLQWSVFSFHQSAPKGVDLSDARITNKAVAGAMETCWDCENKLRRKCNYHSPLKSVTGDWTWVKKPFFLVDLFVLGTSTITQLFFFFWWFACDFCNTWLRPCVCDKLIWTRSVCLNRWSLHRGSAKFLRRSMRTSCICFQ